MAIGLYVFGKIYAGIFSVGVLVFWLVKLASAMNSTPPEVLKLSPGRWTRKEILEAYEKVKTDRLDGSKNLPARTGRRYVVTGGSGLVGGWIVQHLLMRGEDPAAIRILDLQPSSRKEVLEAKVAFFRTDITDESSVKKAFDASWPTTVSQQPLTVFHVAAMINSSDRDESLIGPLMRVNVEGTRNILNAAKAAGASALVATSSASVGMLIPSYVFPPWRSAPKNVVQIIANAEPPKPAADMRHQDYFGNYAKTKHIAEELVLKSDSKEQGLRTGCIRPGHGIYGYGVENPSSLTWQYLSKGGSPSWLQSFMTSVVNAQNVSLAHLQFEAKLIEPMPKKDLGGRAYCVTDDGPPILYYDIYVLMNTLAKTPVSFPFVPAFPLLGVAYIVEFYLAIRRKYASFLPDITGDLKLLQPTVFRCCTVHSVFDDSLAKEELGYRPACTALEGMAMDLLVWNENFERKSKKEKEIITNSAEASQKHIVERSA